MNKQHMRMALRAFKRCQPKLAHNIAEQYAGKHLFICTAIPDTSGGEIARKIVMDSIAPYAAITGWMDANGYRNYQFTDAQRVRHAFVDACIAELERRLSHDDFE